MPPSISSRTAIRLCVLVVAVAMGVAACGGKDTDKPAKAAPAPTAGAIPAPAARADTTPIADVVAPVPYPGLQHQHYRYGPIEIQPGQNPIVFKPTTQKPKVAGYITRFHPDLTYTNGTKPAVDVLHLHHGVWQMRDNATFAAGEEKTITQFPRGFGYRYDPRDPWLLNYMLHNLEPTHAQVYLTWDIDFLPAAAARSAGLKEVKPLWLDVGRSNYPVFDAIRGSGTNGRYRFPEDARGAERKKIGPGQHFTIPFDVTLVAAGGHVHPGGLWVDLKSTRGARTKELFRSEAKYYEPAGAVSWDASMTFTKPGWRVAVHKGDTLSVSATYDTTRASWYEVMGIIDPLWYTADPSVKGVDPFARPVDWHGVVTHGHLAENDNHGGGGKAAFADVLGSLTGTSVPAVNIKQFVYAQGNLGGAGGRTHPATVRQGDSLTFRNLDSPKGQNPAFAIYHTITGCRAPCNQPTGIAYPRADGSATFDSGELGYGPKGATAAENRIEWRTPKNLTPGDYTYFCRVHPFMRGAFRVLER
jgi:plastocyanin